MVRLSHLTDREIESLHAALYALRQVGLGCYPAQPFVRDAVNTLDNADLFAEIDHEYEHRRFVNEGVSGLDA